MTADPSPRFEKKAFHEEAASDSRFPSSPGPLSREAHYVMARNCFSPLSPVEGCRKQQRCPVTKYVTLIFCSLTFRKTPLGQYNTPSSSGYQSCPKYRKCTKYLLQKSELVPYQLGFLFFALGTKKKEDSLPFSIIERTSLSI